MTGCWQTGIMDDDTLFDLIDGNLTDIKADDWKYLETADIIIAAQRRETFEVQHVVVESCVTAGEPYARRAILIADYLSRFTGRPAHAVVASWFIDPEVEPIFASGRAHWYEIPLRYLDSD